MKIAIDNSKAVAAGIMSAVEPGFQPGGMALNCPERVASSNAGPDSRMLSATAGRMPAATRAFTLLEVLLALIVLGVVMVAVHSVFYGALQLRNKTDQAFSDALPLQHTLTVIKRDLANLAVPGGTLSGTLQTTPTASSTASLSHYGAQCGPTFHTASGTLTEFEPWSEMRKVTYYLMPSTNNAPGLDLVRSVTRNLLPVATEEYIDQTLMSGVDDLQFLFYNGTQWVEDWDSSATTSSSQSSSVPQAVRVLLTLVNQDGVVSQNPIEMVVPVVVGAATNAASSTGGGE